MSATASLVDFAAPEPSTVTIPFGKHRGELISAIADSDYLKWVKTADRATPELCAAIDAELATRAPKAKVQDRWRAPQGVPKDVTDMARLLVLAGAGELAVLDDYRVGAAIGLLEWCIGATELESDPGNLPF